MLRDLALRPLVYTSVALLHFAMNGCRRTESESTPIERTPSASASTRSAELPPKVPRPRSGAIETVDVPNDRRVLVVLGEDTKRPVIHLHGMCSEPRSDLEAWGSSVSAYGTVIGIVGDGSCREPPGGATWTTDVNAINARIDAAIDAVSSARGVELDRNEPIVIGESLGAARAQALAARFPAKYRRLVLVAAPEAPSPKSLRETKAVALLAGEREPQEKMRAGATALASEGLDSRFWELPKATHGSYGSDGARIMTEAVAFVATR
jgi:pimeloyl-ACP methyl ester carboxylesterase